MILITLSRSLSAIFISILLFTHAKAAPNKPSHVASFPEVIQNVGEPLTYRWPDGREAEVFFSPVIDTLLKFEFSVFENFCSMTKLSKNCLYNAGVSIQTYKLKWTKHFDPNKLDQIVKTNQFDNFENIQTQNFATMVTKFSGDPLGASTPNDFMECENWDWIRPSIQTNDNILIRNWTSETMSRNPETGNNENRTFSSFFDVLLQFKESNKIVEVLQIGYFDKLLDFTFLLQGDVVQWEVEDSTKGGEVCSVSFKPDISIAGQSFRDLILQSDSQTTQKYLFKNIEDLHQDLRGLYLDFKKSDGSPAEVD